MKNFLSNIPGVKPWLNYIRNIRLKVQVKQLLIGYDCYLINAEFEGVNSIGDRCSIQNSRIGKYTYVSGGTTIQNAELGRFCSIGPGVKIGLGKHSIDGFDSTHPMFYSTRKQNGISLVEADKFEEFETIIIEADVWIGANAVILDGVKIGQGAIVAAGAIVVKDVEPYTIVGGVPAKKIRDRFSEDRKSEVLNSKWWEKEF